MADAALGGYASDGQRIITDHHDDIITSTDVVNQSRFDSIGGVLDSGAASSSAAVLKKPRGREPKRQRIL